MGGSNRSGAGKGTGSSRGLSIKRAGTRLVADLSAAEIGSRGAEAVAFGISKGA